MNRKLVLGFLSAALVVGPALADALKTLKNADKKFSLQVPAEWKTRDDRFVALTAAPSIVINKTPELPNVKVAVMPLRDDLTLESLGNMSKAQWKDIWTVESDETRKIGAADARVMTIAQKIEGFGGKTLSSRVLKAFVIGKENYYIITCASPPQSFKANRALFEEIIQSFRMNSAE